MLTVIDEGDGERVLTARIREATIDADLISALESVLNDVEHGGIENLVLQQWRPGLGHQRVPIVGIMTIGRRSAASVR